MVWCRVGIVLDLLIIFLLNWKNYNLSVYLVALCWLQQGYVMAEAYSRKKENQILLTLKI